MDDNKRKQRLEDAVRDAVKRQRAKYSEETEAALKPAWRRVWLLATLLIVSWGGIAWIWLARPAYIFGPDANSGWNAQRHEASLRFEMMLTRGRIEDFKEENGKLPNSLAELGDGEDDDVGVSLVRSGDSYTLIGRDSSITLRLNEAMSVDSFLGNSLDILRQNR